MQGETKQNHVKLPPTLMILLNISASTGSKCNAENKNW